VHPHVHALFLYAAALLAAAAGYALWNRLRARASVGPVLHASLVSRRWRGAWIAALAAVALLVARAGDRELAVHASAALVPAALFLLARPAAQDRVVGERGVQVGWDANAFLELLEWRLTGEHLRVRVGPEWTAVDLPAGVRERVRARLLALVPERESRFHDRQEPPLYARLPQNRPSATFPPGTNAGGGAA
jgi:hypothetical protein